MEAIRRILRARGKEINITVPGSFVNHDLEVLVFPVHEKKPKYDFSELIGKLEWSGDSIMEQRKIRDEW